MKITEIQIKMEPSEGEEATSRIIFRNAKKQWAATGAESGLYPYEIRLITAIQETIQTFNSNDKRNA